MGNADAIGWEGVFANQDREAMVEVARDVIEIPSETGFEGPIGDYVAERFGSLGGSVEFQEVEEGRNNVLARFQMPEPGPTLLMIGHFDTSTNPDETYLPIGFHPKATLKDNWIYGLGISNMKCAFAGYYSALQMLLDEGVPLRGEIIVAGLVGEIEKAPVDIWQGKRFRGGGAGARFMVHHGVTADFCINGEPSGMRLQTGNAGYLFAKVSIKGVAQHTFSKEKAIDPIPKAFQVYDALQKWELDYQERNPHPAMKLVTNVGAIFGGYPYKPSITAPDCSLYVHVNTLPGKSILSVKRELEQLMDTLSATIDDFDASVEFYLASDGHYLEREHPLVQTVASAHRTVHGSDVIWPDPVRLGGVSCDNSPMMEYGIPSVQYGAGGINLSGDYSMYEPGLGEVVNLDNLAMTSRVYAVSIADLLGSEGDAEAG
jgi:acetylornithine deacetylase/succinyl-diaminopimelate desuccinylase-like protein